MLVSHEKSNRYTFQPKTLFSLSQKTIVQIYNFFYAKCKKKYLIFMEMMMIISITIIKARENMCTSDNSHQLNVVKCERDKISDVATPFIVYTYKCKPRTICTSTGKDSNAIVWNEFRYYFAFAQHNHEHGRQY